MKVPGSIAILSDSKIVNPTFVVDLPGTYVLQLIVNDGQLDSIPATLTVSTQNSPPVANAGPDQTVYVGDTVHLDGSASSDPDKDPLTFFWSIIAKPDQSTSALDSATIVNPMFVPDLSGLYIAQLIVNDGKVDSYPDTTTITASVRMVTVPDVVGMTQGAAQSAIIAANLIVGTITQANSDTVPGGSVISQVPGAGTLVAAGSAVNLVISSGPAMVAVPNVVGMTQAGAQSAITGAKLIVGTITQVSSATVPAGNVVSQNPVAGTSVAEGSPVNLVISTGPVMVTVPNVVGMTQVAAQSTITAASLSVGTITTTNSSTVPAGSVIGQDPTGGTSVVQGSAVALVISLGPVMVTVPDVIGMIQANATSAIVAAGLTVGTVTIATSDTVPAGNVISQDPTGGNSVPQGTAVNLVISLGPQGPVLPPDPGTVAPPIDPTVATTINMVTSFLYTGPNPIQTGVAPGTIEPKRAAVLRGRVLTRDENPLPGVTITILNHSEYGQTLSRTDGMFDMAVNGGGYLTISYSKTGFLPAQRQVNVPWQDFAWLPDVIMIPVDTQVTAIDLTKPDLFQVARGNVVTDNSGSRQATLLFPAGTTATLVKADGTTQAISTLSIRATEYTVGPNGPKAMPAELPPTSGYTYCVELSADEAVSAGVQIVQFSQPLIHYVENYVGFPVGGIVPVGYYYRAKGVWIPSENGRVIKIVNTTGYPAIAEIDTDGDGVADNGLSISDAERQRLAALYTAGQELWRVPISHFTPLDYNWPWGPPDDATSPDQEPPEMPGDEDRDCNDAEGGSIIECQTQTLGEVVSIVGTPFRLHYKSDRVPGRKAAYTVQIPISGTTVPTSLALIELEIFVAGRKFTQSLSPAPNQRYTFTWDSLDAYGRTLQGRQPIRVRIGYVYHAVYMQPVPAGMAFGQFSGVPITVSGTNNNVNFTLWQEWNGAIGPWDARANGLGGWSLNVHHAYNPVGKLLYLGDGGHTAPGFGPIINSVAGTSGFGEQGALWTNGPGDIAAAPDGSIYIVDYSRVWRIGSYFVGLNTNKVIDGIITRVQWMSNSYPSGVAVGPDGSIYISDITNNRVVRVIPDGPNSQYDWTLAASVTTVAGNGNPCNPNFEVCYSGDGGPATQAQLSYPSGLAVGPDGSIYIADTNNNRIRRVGTDGIISTVAGSGYGYPAFDDGLPATQAQLNRPTGVALGSDGSIYIADYSNRIRRVGADGIINTVAGTGFPGYNGDGMPATQAQLKSPYRVAVAQDGSIYIPDAGNNRVRRVGTDGIITTVAGNGSPGCSSTYPQLCFGGDKGPATQAMLWSPNGVAAPPDGSIYIADFLNNRIRRVSQSLPGFSNTDFFISSSDSSELYHYNAASKHLETFDTISGAARYSFTYDNSGRLTAVTDSNGNVTTIERDSSENATAIVGPFGQRTTLSLNPDSYLANLANPAGESYLFNYTGDGLLTGLTDPRSFVHNFTYDNLGLLIKDEDPAGGSKSLSRTEGTNSYQATVTTAMGRSTSYLVENLPTGDQRRTNTYPDGTKRIIVMKQDQSTTTTSPDGTFVNTVSGPDPRFGMQSPLPKSVTVTTPGGLAMNVTNTRIAYPTGNPLALVSLADTISKNGQSFTTVYMYDGTTRTFTTTTPEGRQATSQIDSLGRVIQAQVSGLDAVQYGYDAQGRLIGMTQGTGPEARNYTLQYNPQGYLSSITDPLSNVLRFEYNQAGRLIKEILPDGRESIYSYDANGNITSITPPGRPAHSFQYNAIDLMLEYDPPDVGSGINPTRYNYNVDRQPTQILKPDGQAITFGYYIGGRLSTITTPDAIRTYTYDPAKGYLTGINWSGGNTLSYTYDGMLTTSETWAGDVTGSVSRTYDNNFRVTGISINSGNTITYVYDNDGLMTGAGALTLTRSPQNGLLTGTTLGSVSDTRTYNSFGEPVSYIATYNASEIFNQQFTRNKLGRITDKTETVGGVTDAYTYLYDTVGRLTSVKKNNVITAEYAYDSNGNRLSVDQSGNTITYTYDAQDRLTTQSSALGTQSYEYNANGELITKTAGAQTTQYTYDAFGTLKRVDLPNGDTVEYTIDGKGRRTGKKLNGTWIQKFLYLNQLKPVAELDAGNTIVSRFIYGSQGLVPDYMIKEGVTYRIISDHLGSPRLVVDTTTGMAVQRMDYDEFGNVTNDTNSGFQPFGFAGGIYDAQTQLVRFGARDYDAETGRWTAKDPVMFAGNQLNVYSYVKNNPVNLIDLFGTQPAVLPGGFPWDLPNYSPIPGTPSPNSDLPYPGGTPSNPSNNLPISPNTPLTNPSKAPTSSGCEAGITKEIVDAPLPLLSLPVFPPPPPPAPPPDPMPWLTNFLNVSQTFGAIR